MRFTETGRPKITALLSLTIAVRDASFVRHYKHSLTIRRYDTQTPPRAVLHHPDNISSVTLSPPFGGSSSSPASSLLLFAAADVSDIS